MKKITALLTLSALGLLFGQFRSPEPTAKYCFCYSREIAAQSGSQKPKLLYTDIRTAGGDEQKEMQRVSQKFVHFINERCPTGHGRCRSDLNKQYTLEQAQKHQDEMIAKYKKLGAYELSRVDFQSF